MRVGDDWKGGPGGLGGERLVFARFSKYVGTFIAGWAAAWAKDLGL